MDWIVQAKQRGWGNVLLSLLDVLEPFAPLVGQTLFVAAPAFTPFGGRHTVEELGHVLDDPAGVQRLRDLLNNET